MGMEVAEMGRRRGGVAVGVKGGAAALARSALFAEVVRRDHMTY